MIELAEDILIRPDFNDYPTEYLDSMKIYTNNLFYKTVRKETLKLIINLCRKYRFLDYTIVYIKKIPTDFLILTTDNMYKCVQTECPCITVAINFLIHLKNYIFGELENNFIQKEAEIIRLYELSAAAISRKNTTNAKDIQRKSRKFIQKAEMLNESADVDYYTIELLKRIYLREVSKLLDYLV